MAASAALENKVYQKTTDKNSTKYSQAAWLEKYDTNRQKLLVLHNNAHKFLYKTCIYVAIFKKVFLQLFYYLT